MTVSIYCLGLEHGKFYVGRTNNISQRLHDHFNGNGSEWTYRYKPLYIAEIRHNCDEFDEDKITKQYMLKYGIDNIRGGAYNQVNLSPVAKEFIQHEINNATNRCFKCGNLGHFANTCWLSNVVCFKCNKKGHYANTCFSNHDDYY